MATIWEAPIEIRNRLNEAKNAEHPHLTQASLWVLCSDSKAIRDNRVIATQTRKCTKTEKLSSGHDFKVIIMMETWANLTDTQREIALDEALCRCGVRFLPETIEINGKKEILKDDLGRIIYTDEIAYDKEGIPKWKINHPDAGLFFPLLARHRQYSEDAENVVRALEGQPLKLPISAQRADAVEPEFV